MSDEIKAKCPFRNNLDECQFCGRLGICYTDKQFKRLLDKRVKRIQREKVSK